MCNACAYVCCASDQLRECGCDACRNPDCWERCDVCGEDITPFGTCRCDDEEYPDEEVDIDG